jgi:hypothetical protein
VDNAERKKVVLNGQKLVCVERKEVVLDKQKLDYALWKEVILNKPFLVLQRGRNL